MDMMCEERHTYITRVTPLTLQNFQQIRKFTAKSLI